jgi:hypothetical protein
MATLSEFLSLPKTITGRHLPGTINNMISDFIAYFSLRAAACASERMAVRAVAGRCHQSSPSCPSSASTAPLFAPPWGAICGFFDESCGCSVPSATSIVNF